ncbi:MAG: IS200/IS605 family transposase [Waterburya sp.]
MKSSYRSSRRAVFNLTVHLVFVTKYRRKVIDAQMLEELSQVFKSVLSSWDSELIEFNGEADHVHLLISYPPHKLLSSLIANLKATSSKTMWRKFEPVVSKTYHKRVLIETVNDQLKNMFQIEHLLHRSIWNFLVNLMAGLIAYSYLPHKPSLDLEPKALSALPPAVF